MALRLGERMWTGRLLLVVVSSSPWLPLVTNQQKEQNPYMIACNAYLKNVFGLTFSSNMTASQAGLVPGGPAWYLQQPVKPASEHEASEQQDTNLVEG